VIPSGDKPVDSGGSEDIDQADDEERNTNYQNATYHGDRHTLVDRVSDQALFDAESPQHRDDWKQDQRAREGQTKPKPKRAPIVIPIYTRLIESDRTYEAGNRQCVC
jgi:hypothetical protein